jgi:hypothetical protein
MRFTGFANRTVEQFVVNGEMGGHLSNSYLCVDLTHLNITIPFAKSVWRLEVPPAGGHKPSL